ncbi:MAG TPA: hypothetical protein VFO55_09850, partial [Gemmatimonadaceae bacterium]|nr:hypothetical protein [Gemmatimonadaceae bacterium]
MRRTYHCFPVLLSLTLLMLGPPDVARAQSTPQTSPVLNPGDTVRVWSQTPRLDGAMGLFARIDARELVINGTSPNPYTPGREVAIPLDPMPRVEVLYRRPKSAGRIIAGVLIGAGVGALIGAPLGPILE